MSGNAMTAPAGWVERVRTAAADGTPLWLRGGGTKDFYGRLPAGERFDLTGHAGVVSYEPTELVINYATKPGGSVRAQIEGVDGSMGAALTGDSLATVVLFKSGTVIQPSGKWMSVRLHLECATVYAFELRAAK